MQTTQTTKRPFTLVSLLEWCRRELSWHITTWEDIGSIINGPLLFIAALVAGVNQIKGGAILAASPWIGVTWAIMQVVGIDMQYMASARRAKDAHTRRQHGTAAWWLILAVILAVPVFLANVQFTLQLMLGWSDARAMQFLGLTPLAIAVARAGLQALLAFISAVTREGGRERVREQASVHTDVPPPPKPRGKQPRRMNSNAGISMASQMQTRERRIETVRAWLDANPGQQPSISLVCRLLDITSRSTAQSVLAKAQERRATA